MRFSSALAAYEQICIYVTEEILITLLLFGIKALGPCQLLETVLF